METVRISISEVSKRYGIARSTLYKKIADGVITAHKDISNRQLLDLADVSRVFNIDTSKQPETEKKSIESTDNDTLQQLRDALNKAMLERDEYKKQAGVFRAAYKAASEKNEVLNSVNATLQKQLDNQATQHDRALGIFERLLGHDKLGN